ncbi:MAG: response regulator [Acidobacteria bacterium]|nr:response regulator [Acidobacteriota bacterium]
MRRVLIVDDDPSIHLIVTAAVERAGMQITFAHDGEEALERVRKVNPDLVLLDINMPGIKGDDVMYEIRKDPALRDTPVVFVTGAESAKGFDYERYGAKGLITKPFDPARLAEEISAFLPMNPTGFEELRRREDQRRQVCAREQRASFVERGFKEIELLQRRAQSDMDSDAARRIVQKWCDWAEVNDHPDLEIMARDLVTAFGQFGPARAIEKSADDAHRAFEQAKRDEKWRALDEELAAEDADSEAAA